MCGRTPRRATITLTDEDLAEIDAAHPPPGRKQSLDIS